MDKDRNEMSRRILDFTLEIIYLLSGEEYTIVKKTSGDCTTPIIHRQEPGEWSSSQSPITERSLTLWKIGVVVFLNTDGSSRRNPPERCPSPLYSQDCPEENHNVPENHQGEGLTNIKAEDEEERVRGDQPCKSEVEEEIPGGVTRVPKPSHEALPFHPPLQKIYLQIDPSGPYASECPLPLFLITVLQHCPLSLIRGINCSVTALVISLIFVWKVVRLHAHDHAYN
ncbi:uncharacterized protein LOC142671627 [Rhinoderma darwinii]|uniref:uncharacterized protein LOC142671627 n=1 Tax=Rhinoderma darwinii TaxID=43563 RepID=UPI003F679D4F